MKILKDSSDYKGRKCVVLTLGNFDGVHSGHLLIIRSIVARAKALGCASAVYTFDPHPQKVVSPETSPPLIIGLDDKISIFKAEGVDYLILAKFTRAFAAKHPYQFVKEALVPLRLSEVRVGHDFAFGKAKTGTVEYLKELGAEFGFKVRVIPAYKKLGAIVSSSRIRELIKGGNLREANAILGRTYSIAGKVVKGTRLGAEIGFPTANVSTANELIPGRGVYAGFAKIGRKTYPAAVNIGVAPTFGGKPITVEAHILDFKGDIYGKRLVLGFFERIRGEERFKSAKALAHRIGRDVLRARSVYKTRGG